MSANYIAGPPRTAPSNLTSARIETPPATLVSTAGTCGTSTRVNPTGIQTPLAAVCTVGTFPSFVAPVASSLPASQQCQVSAARNRRAGTSRFTYNQSQSSTPGPSTAIPPRKGKRTIVTPLPSKLKCAIIPFAVLYQSLLLVIRYAYKPKHSEPR